MITIVPFNRIHLKNMVMQQNQSGLDYLLTEDVLTALEGCESYTRLDGDEVLACAGLIEAAPGRALAWAYISAMVGQRMIGVTKSIRLYLQASQYRRIEMDVDCNFKQGHRWAKILGFELECERRKSYTPDGRDCALYAMVMP